MNDAYCTFCSKLAVDVLEVYLGEFRMVPMPVCKDHNAAIERVGSMWESKVLAQSIGN